MPRRFTTRTLLRTLPLAVFMLAGGPLVLASTGLEASLRNLYERRVQATPGEPVIPTSRTVNLTEEHRHTIREVILKDVAGPRTERQVSLAIGERVPDGVVFAPFPPVVSEKIPSLRASAYFVSGDTVVIVDPEDKRIAEIVR